MAYTKKMLAVLLISVCAYGSLSAQESDFDLASQRSESQDVLKVPGQKLDHKGIIINPTPQSIKINEAGKLDITQGVNVNDKQGKFSKYLGFLLLLQKGVKLTIDYGTGSANKLGVKSVSGAYVLTIDKAGISITGYDERGAFYGLQTLKQLIKSPISKSGKLPYMVINDYPDLKYRGVVEGFYGTPWSHEVRMSLIDFYGRFKMNSYLYGPKDDPYHSSPNWRLPYPVSEAKNIHELVEACNRNRVDFVWAIHPGVDIKWNEEDYVNLVNKFEMMYDLGVRSFAIFFDDISGEGTNPIKQTELLNRLNTDFVKVKGDVSSLIVCPTDYSKLWANPSPQGSLAIYGDTLDPSVEVFWTGDAVCTDLTKETMDWVNSRIKRPALYWWNYPVTDYVRHIIMQGPVYGLDTSLTQADVSGLVSNPMEHGEASKLALYGVADYTWNMSAYNPIDNWERAFNELTPEVRDAYRTFAIHSSDTETGYRRDESWETETFRIGNYTDQQFNNLYKEFEKVEKVPSELHANCKNKALVKELSPWLEEFGKLGTRGKKTLEITQFYKSANNPDFWAAYVNNLMSAEDRKAYEAHKSGTMKLQPFYENAMDDMLYGFFTKLTGEVPASYRGIASYSNMKTTLSKLMFDNDSITHYTSGTGQSTGDWIGADLGRIRDVREVSILQGRNSVDDVDYFDHAILEYSVDGKEWKPMIDNMKNQYIVNWTGEPVQAKYIRLRKLESSKKNWAAIRSFEVNPMRAEHLGFKVETDNLNAALYAFDNNPSTSFLNKGILAFEVPKNVTGYTMLLRLPSNDAGSVKLRQVAKNGTLISETTINTPFLNVNLEKDVAKIEIEGNVEIFEIISTQK
ncbi:hyaluronoglucosaminidase [Dysgonomonas alginatilytica]|uniref:Hyaluronoglucosaminidase n=1 Tax=Dysgonomonas alginatilytica TaxID=1605892 RepID=A0A2V3PW60_9BACT|nr:beta-N-acetylglucosaminidase domain-containing protein [Dysgonomonas alginatilytica]PXV69156.1 hyaluronoglucosaminidase [Dysgonomonas alginatilytica]